MISECASSWEEDCLGLQQLLAAEKISQQHLDTLLDMRKFIFYLETAKWPGVPYNEQEFLATCLRQIPRHYETLEELVKLIEDAQKSS